MLKKLAALTPPLQSNIAHDGSRRHFVLGASSAMLLVVDLFADIKKNGFSNTWNARSMWNHARMSDRDISDVTGYTYTYLMNGNTPEQGWQGLFNQGEKVRLRFINSAAMTIFDVRIPGLKMTVVSSDGQNIQPLS